MSEPNDSQMTSSPPAALLSPPESQTPAPTTGTSTSTTMPTAASGTRIANSNGKRPHGALNGAEEDDFLPGAMSNTNGNGRQNFTVHTHPTSGYRWARLEDEPGYSWGNKKAVDEVNRAWETLVHKDTMVKGRYGDPLELAEKEAARRESMK